jgi:hypothetical protein
MDIEILYEFHLLARGHFLLVGLPEHFEQPLQMEAFLGEVKISLRKYNIPCNTF